MVTGQRDVKIRPDSSHSFQSTLVLCEMPNRFTRSAPSRSPTRTQNLLYVTKSRFELIAVCKTIGRADFETHNTQTLCKMGHLPIVNLPAAVELDLVHRLTSFKR